MQGVHRLLQGALYCVANALEHGPGQGQPLRRRVRAKAAGNGPHGVRRFLLRREMPALAQVLANALQGRPLNSGTYVIEHQAAHRHAHAGRQAASHHADQAAHAGAHPVQGLGLEFGQQRQQVAHIVGNLVAHRISQPITFAAPHHIGADHAQRAACALYEGLRQHVKVAPLAREAMHAQHGVGGVGVAPLPIGHAVRLGGGTRQEMQGGRGHADRASRRKRQTGWQIDNVCILMDAKPQGPGPV